MENIVINKRRRNGVIFTDYFAATNSYKGFKSYFKKIFDSRKYERIYVLKGGPGTGKSTFMRNIAEKIQNKNGTVERIFCSSDPDSLDGIIAYKNERRIAILDGTAPHERDAAIPGAIDELINLGDNWDKRYLIAQKEQILDIIEQKQRAYSAAYFYLSISGSCEEEMKKIILEEYDNDSLISLAKDMAESYSSNNSDINNTVLLSSFGKYGSYSISPIIDADKTITFNGNSIVKKHFLTMLYKHLLSRRESMTAIPYSLNDSLIDAIFLHSSNIAIGLDNGNNIVDLNEYKRPFRTVFNEYYKFANKIHSEGMAESERWFKIASDLHTRLEDIYSSAMDFDKNASQAEIVFNEIKNYLEL